MARKSSDEKMTVAQVAEYLGIESSTFRAYVSRDQAPAPDGQHDARTPWWWRSSIDAWGETRPRADGADPE